MKFVRVVLLFAVVIGLCFVLEGCACDERKNTPMKITDEQLINWFTYHSPKPEQIPKYFAIRKAGMEFAATIVANAPESAETTAAIEKVREAVMTANQAIACYDQAI